MAGIRHELEEAGKSIRDAGLNFGWHNHDFELKSLIGNALPLDLILRGKELVLELDLAWVFVAGHRPSDLVRKYSDRLIAAFEDIAKTLIALMKTVGRI